MTIVTFEWGIIQLLDPENGLALSDDRGRQLCLVRETYHGTTEDPKDWGPMPCTVAEAFIRARREQAREEVSAEGGVFIIPH